MTKTKTFVDANILIAAWRGNDELLQQSMEIIEDPDREFIVSDYLKLEVIPKPTFHRFHEEVQFMQTFIDSASLQVRATPSIATQAIALACRYGLSAMDALHAETAIEAKADEFITIEKPTRPLYRILEIKVVSLRS
jgi:predicted nucleic acid-binding protein